MKNTILERQAEVCAEMIRDSRRIVLLSGAGMSTSAGIPDFRGPSGLYRRADIDDPETIFDIYRFRRDPKPYYALHRELLRAMEAVSPTAAHQFFADLERGGRLAGIITQNIDALHQRAGSKLVYEIHGGIWTGTCTKCRAQYGFQDLRDKIFANPVPMCDSCGSVIKTDVVFFGEDVQYLGESMELASEADLLFVVGSSLMVTPAALLPGRCRGKIVVVNRGEVSSSYLPASRITLRVDDDIDRFFTALAAHEAVWRTPEGRS